jgi:hypothetical protein
LVGFDDLFDQRQPQARPPDVPRLAAIDAEKFVKKPGEGLWRNAHPLIRHPHAHLPTLLTRADGHRAAVRRKLDGIGEQIRQHLSEAILISRHQRQALGGLQPQGVFAVGLLE